MASRHTESGPTKPLTPKQARFVAEYLIDLNGTAAAIRCGYKAANARQQAAALLTLPAIADAVAAGKVKQLATAELTAARVLEEMRRMAFFDVAAFFDADGNLLPLHQIPVEARAAIAGLEVARANLNPADGKRDEWLHKIKLAPKQHALEMLGKHFGLLVDRVEHSGGLHFTHEMPEPE